MQIGLDSGITMDDQRLSYHIRLAEYSGLLCSGDLFPVKHSYALAADKLPHAAPVSKEEALARLAKTHFRSHGPATLEDFAWWCGLNVGDCKKGTDSIKDELISVYPIPQQISGRHPTGGAGHFLHFLQI